VLGSLIPVSPVGAQDRGEVSSSENRLVLDDEGFSIALAGGFQLGKQQAGYYLLGSNQIPGLILIKPLERLDSAELDRAMRSGYHDEAVDLTPLGEAVELAGTPGTARLIEVRGELQRGEVHGLLAGYLRPGGGGLLLFAVTTPQQWPQLEPIADKMARSVALYGPDPQVLVETWRGRLAGFRLVHVPNGETDPADADRSYALCADGRVAYEQKPAPGEGPVGAPPASASGHWDLEAAGRKAVLRIQLDGGDKQSFTLTREEHKTYLDGVRYFVLPGGCRL
jgi:hypothetical protein